MEGAYVTFVSPTDSTFGQTDAEGKLKLATAGGDKVPLGDYQISIVKKGTPAGAGGRCSTRSIQSACEYRRHICSWI